ncbi:LOW QUALITY PROTEIN: hypothetical protein V1478_017818 [Vespula squamosa]|uniref:Uncharacterized protein n=1 Tax=Vespula squamosa TaxID=30214 RepID=A0ABD1ZXU7_VESSQ
MLSKAVEQTTKRTWDKKRQNKKRRNKKITEIKNKTKVFFFFPSRKARRNKIDVSREEKGKKESRIEIVQSNSEDSEKHLRCVALKGVPEALEKGGKGTRKRRGGTRRRRGRRRGRRGRRRRKEVASESRQFACTHTPHAVGRIRTVCREEGRNECVRE